MKRTIWVICLGMLCLTVAFSCSSPEAKNEPSNIEGTVKTVSDTAKKPTNDTTIKDGVVSPPPSPTSTNTSTPTN